MFTHGLPRKIITFPTLNLILAGLLLSGTVAVAYSQTPTNCETEKSESWIRKVSPQVREYLKGAEIREDETVFWVYFKDKGYRNEKDAESAAASLAAGYPKHTVTRRMVRGTGVPFDQLDLPVHEPYVKVLISCGAEHRATSKWLNAVTVTCGPELLPALASFDFVAEVDLARPSSRKPRNRYPFEAGFLPSGYPEGGGDPDDGKDPERHVMAIPTAPPDSTDYHHSWRQVQQIGIPALHRLGFNGSGVIVCMLDTGFLRDHPAIAAQQVLAEWDFINDDGDTSYDPLQDDYYQPFHGSITMCTVGGYEPGEYIAPAFGASFLLAKTESIVMEEPVEEDWWVEGIEWADSMGADIVSSSLGYTDWYDFADLDGETTVTAIAADIAAGKGIVVVTAAGNERDSDWDHIITPADANSIMAIGAVDSLGDLAFFSSPGPTADGRIKPEVCARGYLTSCAYPYDEVSYMQVSGTSLSTPLVAGAAALVLQAHPDWNPGEVRRALMETADNAGNPDNDFGWGIIDVSSAVKWELSAGESSGESGFTAPDETVNKLGAYPNPCNPSTIIEFEVPCVNSGGDGSSSSVRLAVYDSAGRLVKVLFDGVLEPGEYTARWNGMNESGAGVVSGVYICRIETGIIDADVRIVLLK